jgi:hypothetical protein
VRRLYGTSPLHLLAHLALLPLCLWALIEVLGARAGLDVAVWLVVGLIVHDVVVLPLYSAADRAARRAAGAAVNYVRVPAALSLLLLAVFWGVIAERGEGAFRAASGETYDGYALRWLLVSAALFAGAGALYALRRRQGPTS